jgi:hypothetical protein
VLALVNWEQAGIDKEKIEQEMTELDSTDASEKARFMPSPTNVEAIELYKDMYAKLEELDSTP